MKVYVLNLIIDYEPGDTIGVFSSKEKAEEAKDIRKSKSLFDEDMYYEIAAFELDDKRYSR